LNATILATPWAFGAVSAPKQLRANAVKEISARGRSAIRRSAIVPGCNLADDASGSAAIKDVNLRFAAAFGIRANSAASRQGSTSNHANAERTLSTMSFLSPSTGANRKASNSDPSWTAATEYLISTTGFHCLYRAQRPTMRCAELLFHLKKLYRAGKT
jgi:hypothetical protein